MNDRICDYASGNLDALICLPLCPLRLAVAGQRQLRYCYGLMGRLEPKGVR